MFVSVGGYVGGEYDMFRPGARHSQCGWQSDFPTFKEASPKYVTDQLQDFVKDPGESQVNAWKSSVRPLQSEVAEILAAKAEAQGYHAILEYELPMERRRPDVVFLAGAAVVILELKGKSGASQADIDQVHAYARDLRCYHRDCTDRPVVPVLVPTRAQGVVGERHGVRVLGPDAIDQFVLQLEQAPISHLSAEAFLDPTAYRPLPTLVQAARELFDRGDIRPIHRARAATDPAVAEITRIIHDAARTKTRRLVLLTGIPGAGKTLVGLRTVHSHYLDDLSVERDGAKPTAPAVFLSGNGPLVEVLQYEFRQAGGGGKAFVRGVKDYVRAYTRPSVPTPPEHVLVFDEAQRAWDREHVAEKHKLSPDKARSEPEIFVEVANRIPEWSVVLGLVGGGQEIHIGEEGGLHQWFRAIEALPNAADWVVHHPPHIDPGSDGRLKYDSSDALNLDTEIRFHLASEIHEFVRRLLEADGLDTLGELGARLQADGYHLRITRDLEQAKRYLRTRYEENPLARYGMVASSKDKLLEHFGVRNDFQSTKRVRFGPWYSDPEDHPDRRSCRHLEDCVTEFGAQGLELDAVLLAWGTDFLWDGSGWSNARARGYRARVKDPYQLRLNAYRVLLTRGRDATVVFVPEVEELNATWEVLRASGFADLSA